VFGEDRVIAELVGERPPLLLEYVRDHDVRALGDEAARVTGAHSTGTARDDYCPIIETLHVRFGLHSCDSLSLVVVFIFIHCIGIENFGIAVGDGP
jgi:hypothetical protein